MDQAVTPDMPILEPQESFPPHLTAAKSSTQNSPASTVSYTLSPHGQTTACSPTGTQFIPPRHGHGTGTQSLQGIPPRAHSDPQFQYSSNQGQSFDQSMPIDVRSNSIEIQEDDDINPEMLTEVAPTFPQDFTPSTYKLGPPYNTGIMANSNPLQLSNLSLMEKQNNNPAIHGLDLTSQSSVLPGSNIPRDQITDMPGFASDRIVIKQEITDTDFEACAFNKTSQQRSGDPDLEQLLIPERRGSGQYPWLIY